MIPMMIQQGYVVIAVAFDVWALAGLAHDGMKAAREVLEKESKPEDKDAGAEEGTAEVVIGEAPPS